MQQAVHDLVNGIDELASLPGVCGQVAALTEDPAAANRDLARLIGQDPGLSLKILRLANSAFYGRVKDVETIEQAVNIIGMQRLRDIVLGTAAIDTFNGIRNELVSMEDFWMHSLYCAIASRLLANTMRHPRAESVFVAGLLHDIGQLVLFHERPEQSRETLLLTIEDLSEPDMVEAEQQVFGFDHCQIGAVLAEKWGLPEMLTAAILYHHAPEKTRQHQQEVALVHIGNRLAAMAELDEITADEVQRIHPGAWATLGLSEDIIPEVMRLAQEQFVDVRGLFLS
ncbi:MAG: HDOD domain-containing protein [Gammaproteobacteria bacterium]